MFKPDIGSKKSEVFSKNLKSEVKDKKSNIRSGVKEGLKLEVISG